MQRYPRVPLREVPVFFFFFEEEESHARIVFTSLYSYIFHFLTVWLKLAFKS